MKIAYQAIFEEDQDGIFVRFPDLQEAFTEGKTMEEALFNAEPGQGPQSDPRKEDGRRHGDSRSERERGRCVDLSFRPSAVRAADEDSQERQIAGGTGSGARDLVAFGTALGESKAFSHFEAIGASRRGSWRKTRLELRAHRRKEEVSGMRHGVGIPDQRTGFSKTQ